MLKCKCNQGGIKIMSRAELDNKLIEIFRQNKDVRGVLAAVDRLVNDEQIDEFKVFDRIFALNLTV